jgi:adenylylsulfate kinase
MSPQPAVVWLTGLSGSGKSTLAQGLLERLSARGLRVEALDGDILRRAAPQTGFSKEDRDQHIRAAGRMASELEKSGAIVIASFISPYAGAREFVRGLCSHFIEVYVSTPLAECERRDIKGLYAKARRGEIKNFTGIDDPYEPPTSPELTIDTSRESEEQSLSRILRYLEERLTRP